MIHPPFSTTQFQALQNNWDLHYFGQTDSTNQQAKALLERALPDKPSVLLADFQHAGRGRRENSWSSPPAQDLLFTALLETGLSNTNIHKVATTTALAVALVLERYGVEPAIKFPNDVYINRRKVAGILIEQVKEFTLIGIGVNVNSQPHNAAATSLMDQLGKAVPREPLLADLLNQLTQKLSLCDKFYPQIKNEIAPLDMLFNQPIEYVENGKTMVGRGSGLSDDGYILVDHGDGPRQVCAGHQFRILSP